MFLVDVGLLSAMSGLEAKTLLHGSDVFTKFKGALTEQYVFQQLNEKNELYYWSKGNSRQKVDLLMQYDNDLLPIECKAEENLKAKSLKSVISDLGTKRAIKVSMKPYHDSGDVVVNTPLYMVAQCVHEDDSHSTSVSK